MAHPARRIVPERSSSAFVRSTPHRIGRRSWAVGALLAGAAFGSRVTPLDAHAPGPELLIDRRHPAALRPWETPEDVFASVYGVSTTPARSQDGAPSSVGAPIQNQPVITFAIPPGPLASALRAFALVTGIDVRVDPQLVGERTAPAVNGALTAHAALQRLLDGTPLSFRFVTPRQVEIEWRVVGEAVEVSDSLPSLASAKFTAPLLDTPQTITVVPAAVIESQGATSLRDVLRNVPGITMQAGEGGGGLPGDTLTMRGFSATNDIFVDGMRDVGPYARDAFNLEQVEVIKGASSSFGGRGSTGGSINLVTKTPGLESIRQGTLGVGTAGYQRTTVDVNERVGALGEGAAVRVNAMWQDAGVPGRREVNNASWAVAPSLALGLGAATRVTFGYQHLSQDNVPDYGLPWGASTDPSTGQTYPTGAFNADPAVPQDNFYGLRDYDFEDISSDAATARVDRTVTAQWTLRNLTRFGRTERDSAITAPRPPNRQLQRRQMRHESLAHQVNLTGTLSTGGLGHTVSAGLDLGRDATFSRNSAQNANQPQTNIRTPNPGDRPFGPMPEITGNPGDAVTRTVGVYLFDTLAVAEPIELSGGLRWDRSDVDYSLLTLATGARTDLARTDAMLSWHAGAVYKPRPAGSIYVGAGTAFTPAADAGNAGTALSDSGNAANNVNLAPEKTRNVEVGTKWAAFGNRLAVNGAVFRTEKTNARTRGLSSAPFVLAGRQRVQGVEIGASGSLAPGWTAFVAYTWMDSEIVASLNEDEVGRDLTLLPKSSGSVWLSGPVGPRVTLGGGAQFMDGVFRNTTTDLAVPGYWLVNATASYAVNSSLTLRVHANNLADASYVDRVGGGHYIPGPRRSFQLTSDVGF